MKKWKTKKAIASQKKIDKILAAYGKAHLSDGKPFSAAQTFDDMGLGKPFFAAMTFDDSKGVWKICPCCGGTSVEKDIIALMSK